MVLERLDKEFDVLVENEIIELVLPDIIKQNIRHIARPYQVEAFARLVYYFNKYKNRRKPTQLLFHMATGSGKTLIMAGAIIELFKMGYRNFIFFVNTDTIIRKTKENFLNPASLKYLFSEQINVNNQIVNIREVDNFECINENDINILFSTIQGLHSRLNTPRENSVSFEDFVAKEIVLISDEAHHVNALTKNKLTGEELEVERSWENTVSRIFNSNTQNIMLEFTATLELSHPAVASKYNSKLLFDYALAKFREDGYSKEVKTIQADLDPIDRAIVAIILSQYKKKVFSINGVLIKPVVMMKSKTTSESAEMEKAFFDKIHNLSETDILKIKGLKGNDALKKAFHFFEHSGITASNLIDELKDDFSDDKIISVNSKNDSDEKQIVINSLEAPANEYRVVFAVDKLNEGWDVLNLFDIVRLYETRDSKGGKPGTTTIQEAQLIGRGARYCPFASSSEQEYYKRKFDNDLENEMRICEELHYHCSHNPRYIQELNTALQEIGIIPKEKQEVFLELKDDFKQSIFYKTGFIFLNKKVENEPAQLHFEYQEPQIRFQHEFKVRTLATTESAIFDMQMITQIDVQRKTYRPILWDKIILKKGMNKISFYRFSNIKRYFPTVKSVDDFIEKKLQALEVVVSGLEKDIKDLSPNLKLQICLSFLNSIADEINQTFGDYRGTKAFKREPINSVFRDKKLYFTINDSDAETGKPTMRTDIPEKFFVDLKSRSWHVYKENYGSTEEKLLVKFLDSQMDELRKKFTEIYLIRNERFFKLFRFSDGKATEPDYVLFLKDKQSGEDILYQLFIEPKGTHLIATDIWKEHFLSDIESEAFVELIHNENIRIIGMPFYNKSERETTFKNKLTDIFID